MGNNINWSLYRAVISVNIVTLITGVAYSWTSPVLPKLNNKSRIEENPFGRIITPFEESWLTSIINVGASIGPFISATVVDKIGRKKTLLILVIPIIVAHLVLAFATDINLYYFSRFLLGLSVGSVYSVVPMYVGEIAEDTNRGALGCFISIAYTMGTIFCFTVGPYLTIQVLCLIIVIPAVLFVILFGFFAPESPYYLLMVKKEEEAEGSLRKLRRDFVEKELEAMRKNVEISNSIHFNLRDLLKTKAIYKGLMIGSGLMFFQQGSGITVVISYMQSIFHASGSNIGPEISTMIVGLVQLSINILTSQLVDRIGRRILLLVSLSGAFLAHIFLGLYFYLKINNFDDAVAYLFWLPVASLILYIAMFTAGLGPVTWAMVGELFPTHFKSYASTFVNFVCLFVAFLLTLFFPNLSEMMGLAFSFWIFAGLCAVGIIFVWRVVPETKGKSLLEIQLILENDYKAVDLN